MKLQIGDTVVRNMAGIKMPLKVTSLSDNEIVCGPWTFDRATGAEIDDELAWGPKYGVTGSFLEGVQ